jgi:hypothetical protein
MGPPARKRLGELLVEAGVIDEHQLRAALGHQRQWGGKLGQSLLDLKLASEPQIVSALATALGYEMVHLDPLQRTASLDAALKLVPREVARRFNVLPLAADVSSVTIAMSDPTNIAVTDELSFRASRRVKIVLAGDQEVKRAVTRLYFPEEDKESRSVELERGDSGSALNRSYEELTDHVQERFFGTTLRELGDPSTATPPPPPAPWPTPAPARRAPAPAAPLPAAASPDPREAALHEALDRMALGEESPHGLKVARLAAAAVKALLRRGLVTEAEILAELKQRR